MSSMSDVRFKYTNTQLIYDDTGHSLDRDRGCKACMHLAVINGPTDADTQHILSRDKVSHSKRGKGYVYFL